MGMECSRDGVHPDILLDLLVYLDENELFDDCFIYCNDCCYSEGGESDPQVGGVHVRIEEGVSPSAVVQYYNEDTITMTFEGTLCSALNDYCDPEWCWRIQGELRDLFGKYGYYYELGYHWSLALYRC